MPRKPHPADLRDAKRIAEAVRFAVHFRKGPTETYHEDCATLADARAAAVKLDAAHGKYGRRAGVYAIGAEGAVTFVPDTYQA